MKAAIRAAAAAFVVLLAGAEVSAQPNFRDALIFAVPPGGGKAPVVLLLEGNGGSRSMHPVWGPFFNERGVAVVQIQSAKARGRQNWGGTGCQLQYETDAAAVVELLKDRPDIDATRFAVMGFSRGGTESLNGGRSFAALPHKPAAIFSFYPGCGGGCPADWPKLFPDLPVHIFYGLDDMWGVYQGTRSACRSLRGASVTYHEYSGAHHGFDAPWSGWFSAGGSSFRYEPNAAATDAAKKTILEVLERAWGPLAK